MRKEAVPNYPTVFSTSFLSGAIANGVIAAISSSGFTLVLGMIGFV